DDHMEIVWKSDGLNSNDDKVSLYNEGDAMKLNNSHKRLNYVQEQGFKFYVTSKVNIPKPESNHRYAWEEYENKIDEIKKLHFD
ncbi:hypothetical protein PVN35_22725, partial [Bacillus paralicheniformis]|nr:hypothetical protein [Bacillus paralicheniformis]